MTLCRRIAITLDLDNVDSESLPSFVEKTHGLIDAGFDELWLGRSTDHPGSLTFTRILTELEKHIFVPLVRFDKRIQRGDWQRLRASSGDRVVVQAGWFNGENLTQDLEAIERNIGFDRLSVLASIKRIPETGASFCVMDESSEALPIDGEQFCLTLCQASVSEIILTGDLDVGLIDHLSGLLPVPIGIMPRRYDVEEIMGCFLAGADSVVFSHLDYDPGKVIALREALNKNGFAIRN
jgi:hypothetical protein